MFRRIRDWVRDAFLGIDTILVKYHQNVVDVTGVSPALFVRTFLLVNVVAFGLGNDGWAMTFSLVCGMIFLLMSFSSFLMNAFFRDRLTRWIQLGFYLVMYLIPVALFSFLAFLMEGDFSPNVYVLVGNTSWFVTFYFAACKEPPPPRKRESRVPQLQ